jgi:hypothetical protein
MIPVTGSAYTYALIGPNDFPSSRHLDAPGNLAHHWSNSLLHLRPETQCVKPETLGSIGAA